MLGSKVAPSMVVQAVVGLAQKNQHEKL
jgi:hypothetical protein